MAMVISLVAIFVISFLMNETNPCEITGPVESEESKKVFGQEHKECYDIGKPDKFSLKDILRLDNILLMLLLYFFIFLAFNFFYVAFPVYAMDILAWNLLELGVFFSVMGSIMVFVQGPVLNAISDKFHDSYLTIAGSILLSVSFFFFTGSSDVIIYSGVILFSIGNGLMWPSFLSILSKVADKKYQGAVQGYASSAGSLASILGLISGGFIYGLIGETIFWIPGILLFIIFLLFFKLRTIPSSSTELENQAGEN
jgi:MFS family permease